MCRRSSAYENQKNFYTVIDFLFIIDSQGKLKYIFNKASGLPDNNISDIFEDSWENLWISIEKGLSKIEYASPFYFYDERNDLSGLGLAVVKHRGVLFTGTTNGLFYLTCTGKFNIVPGLTRKCWSLLSTGDSLLAVLSDGTYRIEVQNNSFSVQTQKVMDYFTYVLCRSKVNPNRIWAGTQRELIALYRTNETAPWYLENITAIIGQEIKSIVEDEKGNLWLGTRSNGTFKVDFLIGNASPKITHFTESHGLPLGGVNVTLAAGHVLFLTGKGLARFDEKENRFFPDNTLGNTFSLLGAQPVFRLVEDKYRNIWFHSASRNYQAILKPDETYDIISRPFLRIPLTQVNGIYYDEEEDSAWFASIDGLIRYDKTIKKNYDLNFSAIIRKVTINGKLIFEGDKSRQSPSTFSYNDRNFRFQFAAPFFEGESETRFRTFLQGYENYWSEWTPESQKEYTNLNSGSYIFRVQFKNVYENLSSEAIFQFKVLPPFYKTWWAFLVYVILSFFLVFYLIKWRSGKLEREKQILERIVKERTQEIKEKNRQLEDQSEKLKGMDQIKSRFFANISHEFRTPLTLIMGPLEQMLAGKRDQRETKNLNLMLRNSQRLLGLINQLLELSKLESGKMKLQAVRRNIVPFLKGITANFQPLADSRELELVFYSEEEDITLYVDVEKLEDVMTNLLINAVKFTPAGGKITVVAKQKTTERENKQKLFQEVQGGGFLEKSPPGCRRQDSVEISVSDTGPGIPREQLVHIFDRFYQAETTYENRKKGTGIGLALVKELVQLHHGKIDVYSHEGKGTEFIISLPMGDEHLGPGEIIQAEAADFIANQQITAFTDIDANTDETDIGIAAKENGILMPDRDIILVVEDNVEVRAYIRGELELNYVIIEAADGTIGISKAMETIPDLIISDIMMPGCDGYELCKTLKKDIKTSHIPIILLSAKASEASVMQGLEIGADDYITKPFSTKILAARIRNLIELRRQLQLNIDREMTLRPVEISVSGIDKKFLKELKEAINQNLADPEFNVEGLARKLYMDRSTVYRKVLALTGEVPTDFIKTCRLKKAADLLKGNFGSVLEVALEVGFSSANYFTKCFKEKFHCLPSKMI